ncbi:hypothetical protein [Flammeovirga sp. SJP92]|uniref:hypothetical protein n=1 Tax=Flammeovirga sp. SJP92 TaxID=1775430 RepID=UPI0012FC5B19|nr:hypothetical protein [Flammeovirga sp. SJP92]
MKKIFYFKLLINGLNRLSTILSTTSPDLNSINSTPKNVKPISYKGLFHETEESLFVQNYIFYADNTFKVEKYEMKFENAIPTNYEVVVDDGKYIHQAGIYINTIHKTGFSNYIREGNSYVNQKKGVLNNKIMESIDFKEEILLGIPWINEYIDPIVFENKIKNKAC